MWKDIEDLESSLSLPELFAILEANHKKIHDERKFFAAIQGIDIDKGAAPASKNQGNVEKLRERIAKKTGKAPKDPNDITRLRGRRAKEKGFGIGMGLDYDVVSADGTITPG